MSKQTHLTTNFIKPNKPNFGIVNSNTSLSSKNA